jgi:hypothetical protein
MKDITVDLLEDFKVDGLPKTMRDTSKGTVVAKVRCFLRMAFRRGWIKEALADRMTGHKAVTRVQISSLTRFPALKTLGIARL